MAPTDRRPVPGTPAIADLRSWDVGAACGFYEGLFGWTTAADESYEGQEHWSFYREGRIAAGIGRMPHPDHPPVWSIFFATDDIDATSRAVEAAGGTVLLPKMTWLTHGSLGVCRDRTGALFGLWEAGERGGAEVVGEPGSLVWCELNTRDMAAAWRFYGEVFGWEHRESVLRGDTPMAGVAYTRWRLGGRDFASMLPMEGDMWPSHVPPHWMVYFRVHDCDASVARAEELGGRVLVPATDVLPGRFASLNDPAGGVFSVVSLNSKYAAHGWWE